jgi:Transposase IS66 family
VLTIHYVWVFTDGTHVVFRMTETREAVIVHEFLSDYQGILISNFYPGYDAVKCRAQKRGEGVADTRSALSLVFNAIADSV